MKNKYDVIVIGAGPGGYVLALECGRRGMSVALVDRRESLGGTCLNIGCIPSKALLESSELFYRLKTESGTHGIRVGNSDGTTEIDVDIQAMMDRKKAIVDKLTGGIASLMKARSIDVIHGRALIRTAGEVQVIPAADSGGAGGVDGGASDETMFTLQAPRTVLATGSVPAALEMLPFDGKRILDSTDALALKKVPESLAVIGAGAVGLELGSVWSRLGSRVTVLEMMDQIIPGADAQGARTLASALKKQGMDIRTSSTLEEAKIGTRAVSLKFRDRKGNLETLKVEKVLVSVGRRAAVESFVAEKPGPALTDDGRFIKVDTNFATSIEGIYAVGDVVGNPMLAHKAEEDAIRLAGLFAGDKGLAWGGPIPGIVYTEPEMAWAGESEESLKESGVDYIKGQFPFAANGRALASEAGEGFVKLLSSPGDGRLLGAVIVGSGASELIAEPVMVMAMGGCAEDIALTVHGHPTLSEAVKEAALSTIGKPLHRS